MERAHRYRVTNCWTGNLGEGTARYQGYSRNHELSCDGKAAPLLASSDPAFRGDASRYNPEELLVASLSSCHMLWYLHLCAEAGIVVEAYEDRAEGTMVERGREGGAFTAVTLRPQVTLRDQARTAEAAALHPKAHALCFIARSVNFPVEVAPAEGPARPAGIPQQGTAEN